MEIRLAELAAALEARLEGDGDIVIRGAAEPAGAGPDQLALAMKPEYADGLAQGAAQAAVLWDGADWQALGLKAGLFVPRPRYAMSGITRALDPGPDIEPGIHPTAVVHPSATIGEGSAIGALVVIGAEVEIGPRARIAPQVTIDRGARIGADALIYSGVRIGHHVVIGDRFIANFNATVGGDGFSFVTPEKSAVENVRESLGAKGAEQAQHWTRIHSLGTVVIGDDVELGANSSVDRGTIRATQVGRGTKIDNLVMLGHNVVVGEDCLFCSQVGVAGSTKIGNRVVLAGKVGVNDNIEIGDDVVAGGATKIFTRVPNGKVILGNPAVDMATQVEINKGMRRLPRLYREVAELKKAVQKLPQTD